LEQIAERVDVGRIKGAKYVRDLLVEVVLMNEELQICERDIARLTSD
jgi:hypothetical protein